VDEMTPAFCRVKHEPEAGTYGDCLRACVATILDLNTEDVPHFFHDGCEGEEGNQRLREWLATRQLAPFWSAYAGDLDAAEIMTEIAVSNPTVPFILYGETAYGGQHVVVCRSGKKVHDPAWIATPFSGPGPHGHWIVLVIARA
jgi:hypothetical protein